MRTSTTRELGAVIRDVRKQAGKTQQDVANEARVERSWIARLEGGKENPTFAKLLAVTSALGLQFELNPATVPSQSKTLLPAPISLDAVLAKFDERK